MVQTSKSGTETILLVDDAEPFRSAGQEILNKYGYKVINTRSKAIKDNFKRSFNGRIKERQKKYTAS